MIRNALVTGLLLTTSSAAMAAEGEGNLFAGDIGNAIWTLVIFVLVILVLGKFAWGPLLESLQQREQFIRDSLEEAKNDREQAEARLAEYSEKLSAAAAESAKIVDEGRRAGETVKSRLEEEAKGEAERMVERAKREIELAKQTAIKDLYATSATLATEIAGRVVERELKPRDHERLIAESIEKLESLEQS